MSEGNHIDPEAVERAKDPLAVSIGRRVRVARLMRDWTQEELGRMVEVSGTQISHWEAGRRKPSAKHLRALAERLAVSTDWLLSRESGGREES